MAAHPFGQNGDPEKAAKVIVEAINKEDPPKMILLGEGAADLGMKNPQGGNPGDYKMERFRGSGGF